MRKYYPGITLFKLIGSILVVLDHIKLPLIYSDLNNKITGLHSLMVIVPCFYIISGFLAYQGWSHAKNPHQYIRRYLMWILSIYIIFFIFYIVENVIPLFLHYGFIPHLLKNQALDIIQKFFDKGPNPALWFIPPLIFGIVVSYYLESRNRLKPAIKIVFGAFVFMLCLNGTVRVLFESYFDKLALLNNKHVVTVINLMTKYLANGLTFVFVGVFIGRFENQFLKIRAVKFIYITLITVAVELFFLNYVLEGSYPYLLIFSMLPVSILAFRGILRIKFKSIQSHHKFINVFTILLYFCHINLINITFRLLGIHVESITINQTVMCIALVIAGCFTLTLATFYVQRNLNVPIKKILSRT